MIYLDTSFIAPLVIAEETSDRVELYVRRLKPEEVTTSLWAQVEMASLIARKVRMGEFSESQARAVRREFDRVLSESFDLILPAAADFVGAAKYLEVPKTRLRAGDALHLSIAVNNGANRILTLDTGFLDAGKQLRLPVTRGIK